jgi:phage gp29-like protein
MAQYVRLKNGLVVPDTLAFADPKARPEMREIATTRDGRDITRGFIDMMMLLAPQDSVLRLRGQGNFEIYREVLRDDQVKAVFDQRRLAVVSREWEVEPGGTMRADKKAADFLKEQLKHIKWDNATDKMLYGVFYGYAVSELLFARDGSNVVIDELRVRDRRRFGYDGEMQLRLLTSTNPNPGEELPPRKFWHFQTGADHDDEPYGLGLAHWLYWPTLFKRGGIKFWLIFLEKFGAPTAKGTYPSNATPEEKSRLLAALEAITTDAGVIMPEGMVIELLEAARSGHVDYLALHNAMNAAITKVTLGQTLTTEASGGQYKADVQMDVRQDLVKADADLVCESFNRGPVEWLTAWNFPGAQPPRVFRRIDDEPDLQPQAERDKVIHDMGFRPSLKYINDTYGGEWEERDTSNDVDPLGGFGRQPPEFAAGNPDDTPEAQADLLEREAQPALDGMIDQIRGAVNAAESLDDLRDRLAALDLDPAQFSEVMQRALAVAVLAGRFEVMERLR